MVIIGRQVEDSINIAFDHIHKDILEIMFSDSCSENITIIRFIDII